MLFEYINYVYTKKELPRLNESTAWFSKRERDRERETERERARESERERERMRMRERGRHIDRSMYLLFSIYMYLLFSAEEKLNRVAGFSHQALPTTLNFTKQGII